MEMLTVAIIVALIVSIILHEVAHGYMADYLGDPTARLQGRLSLNPLVHIDPLGSVILPILLTISGAGILFGWAKPVPYNPYNLRNQNYGEALVAFSGPMTNIILALIFSAVIRSADMLGLSASTIEISAYIVYINILLACFNSIPLPPLDGSKMIQPLLPRSARLVFQHFIRRVESWGLLGTFFILFLFINVLWLPFSKLLLTIFTLFTGLSGI